MNSLLFSPHGLWWIICFQVKYLGEDGEGTPIAGAVAVCNPWDLLVSVFAEYSYNLHGLIFKWINITEDWSFLSSAGNVVSHSKSKMVMPNLLGSCSHFTFALSYFVLFYFLHKQHITPSPSMLCSLITYNVHPVSCSNHGQSLHMNSRKSRSTFSQLEFHL